MLLKQQFNRCIQQRMAGTDQRGLGFTGDKDTLFLKDDAFVALQNRRSAAAEDAAVANRDGHMGNLVTVRFALVASAAEPFERLKKERGDEMWLQATSNGTLHLFPYLAHTYNIHHLRGQRTLFEES